MSEVSLQAFGATANCEPALFLNRMYGLRDSVWGFGLDKRFFAGQVLLANACTRFFCGA